MFETILFPIDASPEAQQAAAKAIEIAEHHHSQLVLLSVVEAVDSPHGATHPEQTSPAAVAQLLEQAKHLFAQRGVNTQAIEREGQPAFVICDVADEVSADLIVMGCRGVGLTSEGQSASVSNRVINLAPCPVMVVP